MVTRRPRRTPRSIVAEALGRLIREGPQDEALRLIALSSLFHPDLLRWLCIRADREETPRTRLMFPR